MKFIIFSGGSYDYQFVSDYIKSSFVDKIIAVDKGLECVDKLEINPSIIIGDFDSISNREILNKYIGKAEIIELNPEKDYTDTHEALMIAIQSGATEIDILGATGTRLDHILANINILKYAMDMGVDAYITDKYQRIRLVKDKYNLLKNSQFGNYVSILPFGNSLKGVNLRGFKYSLDNFEITNDMSIGVSNEIKSKEAEIEIEEGIAILIESKD